MKLNKETYRLEQADSPGTIALIVGIVGLALSAIGYFTDARQMFHSYLVSFVFWVSIGLAGLFFTMLHHLVNAKWSIVLRRFSESTMITLPLMAAFAIPVLLGIHELYHWSHADVVAGDELLQKKSGYLNTVFFAIRTAVYFAIWTVIAIRLRRLSLKQNKGHTPELLAQMRRTSAPGMVLFAITSTFAAFDWLMSLDPHWYSTIFGVYIFSGGFLAVLSFIVLVAGHLRRKGILGNVVTVEHYHDLGKLTFAFIIFWAYMAFSQYFLIWYANIPEETIWYLHRWEGSWKIPSLVIVFGHFAIPFILLITRAAKRSRIVLPLIAAWILLMRWVDLYWVTMPNLHHHGFHLSWMDLTTMAGLGGVFFWYFWRNFTRHPAVPVGDPGLKESIEFTNN